MNDQQTYIAGLKTPSDWLAFKARLLEEGGEELWKKAFQEYFQERLNLRYLHPVKVLQENGTFTGEGFAIMAILCTLIEFLESTVQGVKYKYLHSKNDLGNYEYSNSQDIFVNFLCKRTPFNKDFSEKSAREFYGSIRCGLLHEAQTKNGWKIRAKSSNGRVVDAKEKIVYRDNFEKAVQEFIDDYAARLVRDKELQAAFVRKFDSLSE